MRKIILLTAVIAEMICSGCSKSYPDTYLPKEFSVHAEIIDGEHTFNADLARMESGWQIEITSPETIKGMELSLTDDDCRINFNELNYTAARDELPCSSPVVLTANCLDKCTAGKNSGEINGSKYAIEYNGAEPKQMNIGAIVVNFSDYQKK